MLYFLFKTCISNIILKCVVIGEREEKIWFTRRWLNKEGCTHIRSQDYRCKYPLVGLTHIRSLNKIICIHYVLVLHGPKSTMDKWCELVCRSGDQVLNTYRCTTYGRMVNETFRDHSAFVGYQWASQVKDP